MVTDRPVSMAKPDTGTDSVQVDVAALMVTPS